MQRVGFYLLGFIFLILGFVFNYLGIWRLIMVIVGLILIDMQFTKNHASKLLISIFFPLGLLILTYGLDWILVANLNRVPVFSYEVKSSDKLSTYNSFFYRVFKCEKNLIMDYGYQKSYECSASLLPTHEINAFLSESLASVQKYLHKFVKISGKISKISGVNIIKLSPYEIDPKNTLNGYVLFNTDYRIKINTNNDLQNYRIYDDLTVIGLVNQINDKEIELVATKLINNNDFSKYDLEIIESKEKELLNYVEKENIYLWGLSNIFIHYTNNHIYELSYLITDHRLNIADLIKNAEKIAIKDEEENIVGSNYKLENMQILICQNKKKIISSKKQNITANLCEE